MSFKLYFLGDFELKTNLLSGFIYTASEWVIRFSLANLLWLILNIPILFIVINLTYVHELQGIIIWTIILFIILPFTFYPATQAMFSLARDWIFKKESYNVFKAYFYHFKKGYIKSLASGAIFSIAWLVWLIDFLFFIQQNIFLTVIFFVTGILLYVYNINFFSINAHYDINLLSVFKKTFLITLASPSLFFIVLFSGSLIIFISLFIVNFLVVFLLVALIANISFYSFHKRYLYLVEHT